MPSGDKESEKPVPAQLGPYPVTVEAGKTYAWCACGHSRNQPFCDGAHTGTGIVPVVYTAEKTGTAYFCGCKATKKKPMCDGTHETLPRR